MKNSSKMICDLPQKSTSTFLDQKFWKHFAKNIWEKKSLAVQNVQSPLLALGQDAIFEMLVSYSDHCRKIQNPEGFKFYIDGMKAYEEDVLQILPVKKDKSLSGYHARMEKLFPDYCLVCDELLQTTGRYQNLLTEFTNELYRHVGFPNRFSEMGLYLGNYRKTPFGVHVDRCGVFSFPVAGTKRFRLWTDEYARKNPSLDRAFEYGKHKKHSELMTAQAGDMTYWPSNAWHIAESDGSFSATWSLGVWVDKPFHEMMSETLAELIRAELGSAGRPASTPFKTLHSELGEVSELPPATKHVLKLLQNLAAQKAEETFLKSWMRHISLQGFKNAPAFDFNLTLQSTIKLRHPQSPVLWQVGKTELNLSFGGKSFSVKKSSGLLKLIKTLNSGQACRLKDFLGSETRKQDLEVLQGFASVGAFTN